VNGDIHARFWESAGVRFPRATHLSPFAKSGAKAGSGSHGIDDRAPSRISFFRCKRTLGNSLRARGYESQKREARISVLNRMAELCKPESQAIVGE